MKCNAAGACGPVAAGQPAPQGRPACAAEPATSCKTTGVCDGKGACQVHAAGTVCKPRGCADGQAVGEGKCDGQGVCKDGAAEGCGVFACAGGACKSQCATSADCAVDHFCSGGKCISRVVSVAAGSAQTCAVLKSGQVYCWGNNTDGLLGAGSQEPLSSRPLQVLGIEDATSVSMAFAAACVTTRRGKVFCWGQNGSGELGIGTMVNQGSPGQAVIDEQGAELRSVERIAMASAFVCAVGSATYCWGGNTQGVLGSTSTYRYVPRAKILLSVGAPAVLAAGYLNVYTADTIGNFCAWGSNRRKQVNDVVSEAVDEPQCQNLGGIEEIAGTINGACGRFSDGLVRCWGGLSWKDETLPPPGLVVPDLNATRLVAGVGHSCVVTNNRSVRCWGANNLGQIGDGGSGALRWPPSGPSSLDGRVVGLGSGANAYHTCAILDDGSLQCWGMNQQGQLGGGTETMASFKPVTVTW
jgi:alpha-tubulin suppressor-like RCC1 family protein